MIFRTDKTDCRCKVYKRIRNASILESFFAFFILLLVLFGILQLYQFIVAGMVTEYAAFRAARSSAVGFSDYLMDREARVKVLPVSGAMVRPYTRDDSETMFDQVGMEKRAVERYMEGVQYMDYEYWHSSVVRHKSYRCPKYGESLLVGSCSVCNVVAGNGVRFAATQQIANDRTTAEATFHNYPLSMPLYELFSREGNITIRKSAEMTNHASVFLEE